MAKKIPQSDFRAVRTVLEASDFAYAPGNPKRPVRDLVTESTWEDIQTLPETVSIYTSNDHGKDLGLLSNLWGEWVQVIPTDDGVVHHASLVATDEFQAATFNSLHGFYRVSVACLRSALEQMTIAVDCAQRGDQAEGEGWLQGRTELLFGRACDTLQNRFQKTRLRRIFQQNDGKHEAGFLRELHDALSNYSHARPGSDALHLWEGSNGPIYVGSAFLWTVKMWLFTYAICAILLKIARPETPKAGNIFTQHQVAEIPQLVSASKFLWGSGGPRKLS